MLFGQTCSTTVKPQIVNIFIDFQVLISEIRNIIDSLIDLADAVVEGSDCQKAFCAIEVSDGCSQDSINLNMTFREYDYYNGQVALCLANDAHKAMFYQAIFNMIEFLQYGFETLQELIDEITPTNKQIQILNHGQTDNLAFDLACEADMKKQMYFVEHAKNTAPQYSLLEVLTSVNTKDITEDIMGIISYSNLSMAADKSALPVPEDHFAPRQEIKMANDVLTEILVRRFITTATIKDILQDFNNVLLNKSIRKFNGDIFPFINFKKIVLQQLLTSGPSIDPKRLLNGQVGIARTMSTEKIFGIHLQFGEEFFPNNKSKGSLFELFLLLQLPVMINPFADFPKRPHAYYQDVIDSLPWEISQMIVVVLTVLKAMWNCCFKYLCVRTEKDEDQ